MTTSSKTPQFGMFKPTRDNIDLAWQFNSVKDKNNRKKVTCDFCQVETSGGITRARQHQLGIRGDVKSCRKIPPDCKLLLQTYYDEKQALKDGILNEMEVQIDDDINDDVVEIRRIQSGKKAIEAPLPAAKKTKGSLDLMLMKKAEHKLGKYKRQTSIIDTCDKEARARTVQYIARFFYTNEIAFSVARSKSFKLMLEEVGNYDLHLKPPSYHELRVPLLEKELEYTKALLNGHQLHRAKYGCSIMSDGWTDRKNRTLINFLVNSTAGTMFVKSIDAFAYMKTEIKIFELLENYVEEIGEQNIVQVVTDNGNLMLEDIRKIAKVKTVIQKEISLVDFIYNHTLALNIMRKNTDNVELVRHGVTRFATTFLTLQRLHKQKTNLRKMFTSEEWLKSKAANDPKGKKATRIVLLTSFWNDIIYTLKVMEPLVQVLRLVDNEKKPAMGYIYICSSDQGYYLNPKYFYSKPEIENDPILVGGLHLCIKTLSESHQMSDMTTTQLSEYKIVNGLFGLSGAIRQRATLVPVEWWKTYGAHTPLLQLLAIKVLSLTCSFSGCERNWSIFEYIHSKKRSRLEHKRLEDLIFVKYNQALKERYDCRDVIDPIILNDDDDYINEFVEELVYAGDNQLGLMLPMQEVVVEEDVEEVEPIYVEDDEDEEEENEEYIEIDGEEEEEEEEEDYVER
ncbi:uncharacterized protein [Cicer arietinum]|uniref:Uncharacterized protein LOC101498071 n=1 Tax=Cicer arietinum TaxID=3827 RepID=A0A1S2Y5G3_CICAR|nr:uncharacterized protein LOC101498071 [Cicer arietinum]